MHATIPASVGRMCWYMVPIMTANFALTMAFAESRWTVSIASAAFGVWSYVAFAFAVEWKMAKKTPRRH